MSTVKIVADRVLLTAVVELGPSVGSKDWRESEGKLEFSACERRQGSIAPNSPKQWHERRTASEVWLCRVRPEVYTEEEWRSEPRSAWRIALRSSRSIGASEPKRDASSGRLVGGDMRIAMLSHVGAS
eukprot:scaffold130549_cov31-Tisochrysis_lutea.AAC.4